MDLPLEERKAMLQELVAPVQDHLVFVGSLPAEADLFEQAVMGAQLEGFVAKRRSSTYTPGVRSRDWLKIKRPGWQEGRTWRK
jgi:bifunctional non-homologous end joining protein LigD